MAKSPRDHDSASSAAELITSYLAEQHEALAAGDGSLRSGGNPIHPTRVATRRFRSTLRVYSSLFEPAPAASLDLELSWYAELLGEVRDRQVQRARLAAAIAELPPDLVSGTAAASIEERLLSEQQYHEGQLIAALHSERYRILLATTAGWATSPPVTGAAAGQATLLRRYVRKAARQASKKLTLALDREDDDEALHSARKAAKRARYAVELAEPSLDKNAAEAAITAYKTAQDVLGEHQDAIVAADLLRQLANDPEGGAGRNGVTYGLLYAHEASAKEHAREVATKLAERPPYAP